MKIAAVSMIKDEGDIIESFIRINSRWADCFFIVDNGSCDNTAHILGLLNDEGFPIIVTRDLDISYPQERITTALVRKVAGRSEFDFIFPIDGDEFIAEPDMFRDSLVGIGRHQVGSVEWVGLVPNDGNSMQRPNPLFDGFGRRRTESSTVRKIILPNSLAKDARIAMGNHFATNSLDEIIPNKPLPVALYHVPVRSKEQLVAKALIGSNKLSIKHGRSPGQGFHWDLIARQIRESEFELTDEQLRNIALSYGWPADHPIVRDVLPISICPENQVLRYADLGRVNLSMLLDGFARQLCLEIAARPRSSTRASRNLTWNRVRRMAARIGRASSSRLRRVWW